MRKKIKTTEEPRKCKYCDNVAIDGNMCSACKCKRKLLQEFTKACEPFREIKKERDKRK